MFFASCLAQNKQARAFSIQPGTFYSKCAEAALNELLELNDKLVIIYIYTHIYMEKTTTLDVAGERNDDNFVKMYRILICLFVCVRVRACVFRECI